MLRRPHPALHRDFLRASSAPLQRDLARKAICVERVETVHFLSSEQFLRWRSIGNIRSGRGTARPPWRTPAMGGASPSPTYETQSIFGLESCTCRQVGAHRRHNSPCICRSRRQPLSDVALSTAPSKVSSKFPSIAFRTSGRLREIIV